MSAIDNLLQITVSVNSAQPQQANFGVPAIVGYHARFPERTRTYDSLEGLEADGFTAAEMIHKAATKLMSADNAPAEFIVGRRALPFTKAFRYTPVDLTVGAVHSVRLGTETGSYTVQAADTVADVCDGLFAAIALLTGATGGTYTPTDDTTHITITFAAGENLGVEATKTGTILDQTADPGIATDLSAIYLENPGWYAPILDSKSSAEIAASAAWLETRKLMGAFSSSDSAMYDPGSTTDAAYLIKNSDYKRTHTLYEGATDHFLDAGLIGNVLPRDPGSYSWFYKTAAGVPTDNLNVNQINALEAKNAGYYIRIKGLAVYHGGKSGSGEWMDTVRGSDHLAARCQERYLALQANNAKVAYTDGGIAMIQAEIESQANQEVISGFLSNDPAPTVTVPKASSVASADKVSRTLRGVKLQATLAGAIIFAKLEIVLTN